MPTPPNTPRISFGALWTKYHALGYPALLAVGLFLPTSLPKEALARAEANGPILLKLVFVYLAYKAAMSRAPKDAPPQALPPSDGASDAAVMRAYLGETPACAPPVPYDPAFRPNPALPPVPVAGAPTRPARVLPGEPTPYATIATPTGSEVTL